MEKRKKTKIVFYLGMSLYNGRGYERTTLAFVRNMDLSKFDVTILHTDMVKDRRLDDKEIDSLPKNLRIIEINMKMGFARKLGPKIRRLPLGKIIELIILDPLVLRLPSQRIPKDVITTIREADIVYLADPADHTLFRKLRAKIIGSNQGMFENPQALYTRIIIKLIRMGILFRRIGYFHFFPMNRVLSELLPKKESVVLPSGIDIEIFSSIEYQKDRVVRLFFIGALEEWKGLKLAIKAFSIIKTKVPIEFHIAGAGSLEEYVNAVARRDQRITYHGVVTEDEKANLLKDCDLFLYPSRGETFGIVIVEAMAAGEYVISGERLRGNFEDASKAGYISFCEYDPDKISNMIDELVEKISEIRLLRKDIHEYALKEYDWKNITDRLSEFFLSITKQ